MDATPTHDLPENEDAYREAVEPLLPDLERAARYELDFYEGQGHIHDDDFTPEEVVGEGLVQAWSHREAKPAPMTLRGWLLGTQHRALRRLVEEQRRYRSDKKYSLDAPIPNTQDDSDYHERYADLYQPERHVTWEDVTPSADPVDLDVSLDEDERGTTASPEHALMLHDEFEMDPKEVAFTMNLSANALAAHLAQARSSKDQRGPEEIDPLTDKEVPNPPSEDDR